MKISRARKVHKTLSFYSNNFGFRQPYQLLIDGTLCFLALKNKINLQDQLPKYFGAEVKLLTTQCVILETEKLGPTLFGAMLIAKQFPVHRCGHDKKTVSGSECFLSMLGKKNESRYIVATQDRDLQKQVRLIPGAPLLYIHKHAPTLEAPSPATLSKSAKINEAKFEQQPGEAVKEIRRRVLGEEEKPEERKHRRKRPSGPNPLSCKKKKKKKKGTQAAQPPKAVPGKVHKKARKRVKIAQHVKEHLQAIKASKPEEGSS